MEKIAAISKGSFVGSFRGITVYAESRKDLAEKLQQIRESTK